MLGEQDAKEKLKEETIENLMTIAENHGMLPTADFDTLTNLSKDVYIDLGIEILIKNYVMSVLKTFVDPQVNTNFEKYKEIESLGDRGQEG